MPRTRYDDDDYGDDAQGAGGAGGAGGSYGGGFYGTGDPTRAGGSYAPRASSGTGGSCGAGGEGARGGGRGDKGCIGGGCGGVPHGGPLSDRDLPQDIDMDDEDDDLSEAPSEECDRCGREFYGQYCPSCGPESGPKEMPKSWIRVLGLVVVAAFVIAVLSVLR